MFQFTRAWWIMRAMKLRNTICEPRTYELQDIRHGAVRQPIGYLRRGTEEGTSLHVERRQVPSSFTFMAAGSTGDTLDIDDKLTKVEPFVSSIKRGALVMVDKNVVPTPAQAAPSKTKAPAPVNAGKPASAAKKTATRKDA